ncbi:ferredoxin [Caulobacter soli]|uniref:ferredoxin n=1 Tax=Caulobacter soli TaxID=2708539 RepID=UPI0013EC00E9|nr:ferredoxin [Caulobacter soli]
MKVHINQDVCAGFGICVGVCPEVFELHDDGYATVLVDEVPPDLQDLVRTAESQCPARAISVSDDASS